MHIFKDGASPSSMAHTWSCSERGLRVEFKSWLRKQFGLSQPCCLLRVSPAQSHSSDLLKGVTRCRRSASAAPSTPNAATSTINLQRSFLTVLRRLTYFEKQKYLGHFLCCSLLTERLWEVKGSSSGVFLR